MGKRRTARYSSETAFGAGRVFNEPTPESDPVLADERPQERPGGDPDPQSATRPGVEGGVSFWDLWRPRDLEDV